MDFLWLLVTLLGIAVLIASIYLLATGGTIPPGIIKIFLIAVILFIIVCIAHSQGCRVPVGGN